MRRRIKGLVYLGLAVWLVHGIFYKNAPKVSTYTINQERGLIERALDKWYKVKPDTSKHAIIQISSLTKKGGTCTAFVISDTTALTAAHCMEMTEIMMVTEVPEILAKSLELEQNYKIMINYLKRVCDINDIACQRELRTTVDNLSKELAARKRLLSIKPDTYKVIDIEGLDTGLKVSAYSKDKRRDYGFIRGDFKDFKKLPVRTGWHVKPDDILRACGFFGSKFPPQCVDFKAIGNFGFHYACEGVVVPGVSGGPVIDEDGYVVGVVVSAHDDFVAMVPTLGMLDILSEEEFKKIDDSRKKKNK